MKALIVEDMPESQSMLTEVATSAFPGIACLCVADIQSALSLCNSACFELALIDLSLPDGSGHDVIRKLACECPDCTIVVATIFDDDDHLFPALRAGAQGYLLKDEPPERLAKQLQGIREGRPPLSSSVARRMLAHFREEEARQDDTHAMLSPREREVLRRLARGLSIAAIAQEMGISPHTVGDHVKNIYRKLNIASRAEAALQAKDMGLV